VHFQAGDEAGFGVVQAMHHRALPGGFGRRIPPASWGVKR